MRRKKYELTPAGWWVLRIIFLGALAYFLAIVWEPCIQDIGCTKIVHQIEEYAPLIVVAIVFVVIGIAGLLNASDCTGQGM